MRYPEFIKEGDTLGFAAPSFGCATEPYRSGFDSARKRFSSMGFKELLGPNCYASDGIGISSTPESCGRELTGMYCGDIGSCSAIISCGGGELMCETLEHIDFARIKSAVPKWFVGYSDNTNFIFPLVTMCDTAALYAPCAAAYGMSSWHKNLYDTFDILTGRKLSVSTYGKWEKESLKTKEAPLTPYNCTEETKLHICTPDGSGSIYMKGRLLGGCLDTLVTLCGTDFDHVSEFNERYSEDGVIWFLESCDLNVLSIRRAFWQLEHAGWFDNARGFIIGRPYHFDEPIMGLDRHSAVMDIAGRHNVPVVMDADIGHLPPMMPLAAGSMAEITGDSSAVKVDMMFI